MAGWEFVPGLALAPGIGSASLEIDDAVEVTALVHLDRDQNSERVAGVAALHDWCWGDDGQWLYCESADQQLFSHDHGWYFPESGPNWDENSLLNRLNDPHPFAIPLGVDSLALETMAGRLEGVTRVDLLERLRRVPVGWEVPDSDLEALGYFLLHRVSGVADRLRASAGGPAQ